MVFAELGSSWAEWLATLAVDADDVLVVQQEAGEPPAAFATRARSRVVEASLDGDVTAAALVGGPRWDADILASRSLMLRAIVTQMGPESVGTVFLDDAAAEGAGRFAMQALATVVEDQVGSRGAEIVTTQGPAEAERRVAA
ncbi:MAG: hypothetical protein ACFCGT_28110 [Sandaracinaceae bacterium]